MASAENKLECEEIQKIEEDVQDTDLEGQHIKYR
jgi:hypothetical protein